MPSYNKKCLLFSMLLVRILVLKPLISWGTTYQQEFYLLFIVMSLNLSFKYKHTHTWIKASTFFYSKTEKDPMIKQWTKK